MYYVTIHGLENQVIFKTEAEAKLRRLQKIGRAENAHVYDAHTGNIIYLDGKTVHYTETLKW